MNAILEVEGIQFDYGEQPVLQGVSFKVERGSFISIVGPNGAGKSTLLAAIAATLRPKRGRVLVEGRQADRMRRRELASRMAVVPQQQQAGFHFNVLQSVLMGRYIHQVKWSGERLEDMEAARKAMLATGTWDLRDRDFAALSGGERQRVVIARALAQGSNLLLLDEPTTHLDIGNQVEILGLLRNLQKRDRMTVITVMHDLNLASQYSDHFILMANGSILSMGPPAEVLTADNIRRAYGAEVLTYPHPVMRVPQMTILSRQPKESGPGHGFRVHLVTGGGAGAQLMESLTALDFAVSAGVLNQGDTDWEAARLLGLTLAEEAPFSDISRAAYRRNRELAIQARAVLLADMPFGRGNLLNLAVIEEALTRGIPVFALGDPASPERDYTGGRAMELVLGLKLQGLRLVDGPEAAVSALLALTKDFPPDSPHVGERERRRRL